MGLPRFSIFNLDVPILELDASVLEIRKEKYGGFSIECAIAPYESVFSRHYIIEVKL